MKYIQHSGIVFKNIDFFQIFKKCIANIFHIQIYKYKLFTYRRLHAHGLHKSEMWLSLVLGVSNGMD